MSGEHDSDGLAPAAPDKPPATVRVEDETTSALVEELRALARSRSALQFAETPAPIVDDLAASRPGAPTDGRQQVLDDAIELIRYPQYKESARALLGSYTERWQPLTQRGEIAAAQFGISYDGFRRARTTGPSLLDETLSILAQAILQAQATESSAGSAAVAAAGTAAFAPDADAGAGSASRDARRPAEGEEAVATAEPAAGARPPVEDPAVSDGATSHDQTGHDKTGREKTGDDQTGDEATGDRTPARTRRSLTLAGIVALFVFVLIVGAVLATRSGDDGNHAASAPSTVPPTTASAVEPRAAACPATTPDVSGNPELAPYVDVFAARTAELTADPATGCPTGGLQKWRAFVYQQFAGEDGNTGVLATTDPTGAIWFTDAQWGSYHQVGGKSGDNAQGLIGIAQPPEERDGYIVIPTDKHTILVGETPNSPHFFLLGPARVRWEQDGGAGGPLGLPTSNPVVIGGALTQDFEGGYLEQLPDTTVVSHLVADPGAELPPLDDLTGKIVRHADATSWYVAPDGRRYWIPSGEVWECLGGAGSQIDNDIRGYAIATLPYGGPATC